MSNKNETCDRVGVEHRVSQNQKEYLEVLLTCRVEFVKLIRGENFYMGPLDKWSLQSHHRGKVEGFKCQMLQKRWEDFLLGWKAAKA